MSDDLKKLMAEATDTHPLPWAETESIGMDEAWCDWHEIGPLSLPGGKPDKALSLMYAAVNALPELLAKVKRLEEVLVRFADLAEVKLVGEWKDHESIANTDLAYRVKFGDLRRARAALKETPNG